MGKGKDRRVKTQTRSPKMLLRDSSVRRKKNFTINGPQTPGQKPIKMFNFNSIGGSQTRHKRIKSENFVLTSNFKTPKASSKKPIKV